VLRYTEIWASNMSFTQETKKELCSEKRKHDSAPCCKDALLHGLLLTCREYGDRIVFSSESQKSAELFERLVRAKYKCDVKSSRESIAGHKMYVKELESRYSAAVHGDFDLFREPYRLNEGIVYACESCSVHFLKGLFIGGGYVSEPTKESRLELRIRNKELAEDIEGLLSMIMLPPNMTVRRGKPVLLYKKSTSIENFLGFIGADTAVLELMSEKPVKELRNNTNRRLNLETSGINRSIKTAVKQTAAVKALCDSGLINGLSAELKATAMLRLEYSSLSLEQLALKHEPPITKSGLNHRMEKIMELAKKLEK